jgi:hypothetical protein
MEYKLDSNTKYIGKDGFYHYKPFGVGKYYKNIDFYQKLPLFTKYGLTYKSTIWEFGDNGLYNSGIRYDTFFVKYKMLKVGYIPQSNNFTYGICSKYINIEISQNLKYHSRYLKFYLDIAF